MENHYGIAVNNKFSLFCDDELDPLDYIKAQEEAKLKKKEDKTKKDAKNEKTKANKIKTNKKNVVISTEPKTNAGEQINVRKEGRGKPRQETEFEKQPLKEGNRGDFAPRRQEQKEWTDRPPRSQNDFSNDGFRDGGFSEGRGRGRGDRGNRRGGRGRGGAGRGFERQGKRDFDRHSGSDKTGIKAVEKKDGGGAHNWGTINDDIYEPLNETQNSEEGVSPAAQETENLDPNTEAGEITDSPSKVEEEEQEMTLDEWKAMQKEARAQPTYTIRKAGEGVDDTQWKKTYELKKKQEKEVSDEESEEEDDEYQDKRIPVGIDITFNDARRGGRGGRGRGRGRGDFDGGRGRGRDGFPNRGRGGFRGRGSDRGGNSTRKEPAYDPKDESEFPALS